MKTKSATQTRLAGYLGIMAAALLTPSGKIISSAIAATTVVGVLTTNLPPDIPKKFKPLLSKAPWVERHIASPVTLAVGESVAEFKAVNPAVSLKANPAIAAHSSLSPDSPPNASPGNIPVPPSNSVPANSEPHVPPAPREEQHNPEGPTPEFFRPKPEKCTPVKKSNDAVKPGKNVTCESKDKKPNDDKKPDSDDSGNGNPGSDEPIKDEPEISGTGPGGNKPTDPITPTKDEKTPEEDDSLPDPVVDAPLDPETLVFPENVPAEAMLPASWGDTPLEETGDTPQVPSLKTNAVPEPSTLGLLMLGLLGVWTSRKKTAAHRY